MKTANPYKLDVTRTTGTGAEFYLAPTHDGDNDMRLTRSGWVARNIIPGRGLDLDYEGVQFKRSQRVVRYHDGSDGYDWPEVVPASVRAKVARLLDGGE